MLNHHGCYKTDTDKPLVCSLWLTSCCHTVYCPLSRLCVAAGILCAFSHNRELALFPCLPVTELTTVLFEGRLGSCSMQAECPPKPVISGSQLLISLWFTSYKAFLVLSEKVPQKVLVVRDFYRAQEIILTTQCCLVYFFYLAF